MARIRYAGFGGIAPDQLQRVIGGAQENFRRAGEMPTGGTYSMGVPQGAFPGERLGKIGLTEGEFGASLNNRKHPMYEQAQQEAKLFYKQAMASPLYPEFVPADQQRQRDSFGSEETA